MAASWPAFPVARLRGLRPDVRHLRSMRTKIPPEADMIHFATGAVDPVSAPPLAPIERPIDLEHLSHMTLGEVSLEREVLQLFGRQAEMLMVRMQTAAPAVVAAAAHTLKGSARGIG